MGRASTCNNYIECFDTKTRCCMGLGTEEIREREKREKWGCFYILRRKRVIGGEKCLDWEMESFIYLFFVSLSLSDKYQFRGQMGFSCRSFNSVFLWCILKLSCHKELNQMWFDCGLRRFPIGEVFFSNMEHSIRRGANLKRTTWIGQIKFGKREREREVNKGKSDCQSRAAKLGMIRFCISNGQCGWIGWLKS